MRGEISKKISPKQMLQRRHSDMQKRVAGKPLRYAGDPSPWIGMEIEKRDEFVAWGMAHPEFRQLYREWVQDECRLRSTPTAHRVDRSRGYTFDNIQWMKNRDKAMLHLKQYTDEQMEIRVPAGDPFVF